MAPTAHVRTRVIVVAVEHYEDDAIRDLDGLTESARTLLSTFGRAPSVETPAPELIDGGTADHIVGRLTDVLRTADKDDRVIVIWSGHGDTRDRHYLLTADSTSDAAKFNPRNTFSASEFASALTQCEADRLLVIIDACFSGEAAVQIAQEKINHRAKTRRIAGRQPWFGVASTATATQQRLAGVVPERLALLLGGDPGKVDRDWGDSDPLIRADRLLAKLETSLTAVEHASCLDLTTDGLGDPAFIPNPRFCVSAPMTLIDKRVFAEVTHHLEPSSRGTQIGQPGWYFAGRANLLRRTARWLESDQAGMTIITGPPGTGKSAVVGRLVTMSLPEYRNTATAHRALDGVDPTTLPRLDSIHAVVHAKGKTLDDVVQTIAAQLDLTLTEPTAAGLLAAVAAQRPGIAVCVDALDEAASTDRAAIAHQLLVPLAQRARCRVLVGCRRRLDGTVVPDGPDRHDDLHRHFGDGTTIEDLADDPDTDEAITDYLTRRFQSSAAAAIALIPGITARTEGSFLYARVVADLVLTADKIPNADGLPDGVVAVVDYDLNQRFGQHDVERAHRLLRALAWANGAGLSRGVWPAVANAVSDGPLITSTDVTWALDNLGWQIVEAAEDNQTVYRLMHQSLTDHYRNPDDRQAVNSRIYGALTDGLDVADWLRVDPYLVRHLASHAASADRLDDLLHSPGALVTVNPPTLANLLRTRHRTGDDSDDIADIYVMSAYDLPRQRPPERSSILHLRSLQQHIKLDELTTTWKSLPKQWSALRAVWTPSTPHETLTGHVGRVWSVAVGMIDGRDVIVSGGDDGTVRVWDPTGTTDPVILAGHTDQVWAVAVGVVDGRDVVVSGGADETVRVWDPTGSADPVTLKGHTDTVVSVAVGVVDGRDVVVSGGSDGRVQVWDLSGTTDPITLPDHREAVSTVAVGVVDGRDVIVSGGGDGTVRVWDPTGSADPVTLKGHTDGVSSVAVGVVDGRDVVVSGGADGTVRVWDPTGSADPVILAGGTDVVSWVGVGAADGRNVIVSYSDWAVRVWDPTGSADPVTLTGHTGRVVSAVLGVVDGRRVIVSGGGDGAVRVWDPARTSDPVTLKGHTGTVVSVAVGVVDGRDVIVSGGGDGAVRVWDPTGSSDPVTLKGHTGTVVSVAVGVVDGRDVVVSGGADGTVRVWDLAETVESMHVAVRSPCRSVALRNDGLLAIGAYSGLGALVLGPDPVGLLQRGEAPPLPFRDQRHQMSWMRRPTRLIRWILRR